MNYAAASTAWGDLIGLVLIAAMWALSLAALAGLAYLLGRWFTRRQARISRPAEQGDAAWRSMSRSGRRSVRRGQTRSDNASDLDGYV